MKITDKLAHCAMGKPCVDCEFDKRDFPRCVARLLNAARDEIERLESRLATVEKVRDAAIADLNHLGRTADDTTCHLCNILNCSDCRPGNDGFEWRGIRPESSKEAEENDG